MVQMPFVSNRCGLDIKTTELLGVTGPVPKTFKVMETCLRENEYK